MNISTDLIESICGTYINNDCSNGRKDAIIVSFDDNSFSIFDTSKNQITFTSESHDVKQILHSKNATKLV